MPDAGRRTGAPSGRRGRAVGEGGAQHGAAAVDAGAHGAELGVQDLGDLLVGEPLDVAEHDGGPEVGRQGRQRALDVVVEGAVGVRRVGRRRSRSVSRSARSSESASKRIRCLRRAWSRKRLVVIRCSQPSKVPGV